MTDLSGITVTAGVLDPQRKEALGHALDRIGGKLIDSVRIDTTHFVCAEGRGPLWEKAVEMNIPVVVPEWVDACESEGTIVGVRDYYLNADPKARKLGTLHGSSHQRTTSTMSTTSTVHQGRPSPQPPISEEDPAHAEPPLTPFPRGETSIQPHALAQEVGSEDEGDAPPPPPPKDESDDENEFTQQNGDARHQDGFNEKVEAESGEGDEHTSRESTLPQHMPDGDEPPNHDESNKAKGKESEGDFNEVPL